MKLGACCRLPDSDAPAFLLKIFAVILFSRNWDTERKLKCHFQETLSVNLHKIMCLSKSICKSIQYVKSSLQSSLTRKIPIRSTHYYFPIQKYIFGLACPWNFQNIVYIQQSAIIMLLLRCTHCYSDNSKLRPRRLQMKEKGLA